MSRLVFRRNAEDPAEGHGEDVDRMEEVLAAVGDTASRRDLVDAWEAHSDHSCAGWLILPDSDEDLLDELHRMLDRED